VTDPKCTGFDLVLPNYGEIVAKKIGLSVDLMSGTIDIQSTQKSVHEAFQRWRNHLLSFKSPAFSIHISKPTKKQKRLNARQLKKQMRKGNVTTIRLGGCYPKSIGDLQTVPNKNKVTLDLTFNYDTITKEVKL